MWWAYTFKEVSLVHIVHHVVIFTQGGMMIIFTKWKKVVTVCILTLIAAVAILTLKEELESEDLTTPVILLRGRRNLGEGDIHQKKVFNAVRDTPPTHVATVSSRTPEKISDERAAMGQYTTIDDVKAVYMDAFRRWNHPLNVRKDGTTADVPVFWRIPQAGGDIVEDIMSDCYGLSLASASGAIFEDEVCAS